MAVVSWNRPESFPGEAGTEACGSVKCMSSRHREEWKLGRKDSHRVWRVAPASAVHNSLE